MCGQDHITSVLRYEVQNDSVSHAYLFCGTRGTGKTTCAKILAKAVNCLSPKDGDPCGECEACRLIEEGSAVDIIEMDAASNNGVENIRDIRDEVIYTPTALKNKVYIIDEVHMLSASAFNALLKTLEEPPAHVIFILATTELQKLPATIVSRCQRFDFHRLPIQVLADRLAYIAERENTRLEPDAAFLLARLASGGMRDAISLLELNMNPERHITAESVASTTGITGRDALARMVKYIAEHRIEGIFEEVALMFESSKDMLVFWQDLLAYYRDMLVVKTTRSPEKYLDLTVSEQDDLRESAKLFTKELLLSHIKILNEAYAVMQRGNSPRRLCAEFALIRMTDPSYDLSPESINARMSALEDRVAVINSVLADGSAQPTPVHTPAPSETSQTPVSEKAQQETPDSSPQKVRRAVGYWMEAVRRFETHDKGKAAFLANAKAYRGEDKALHVLMPNRLSLTMLDQPECRELLRGIVSSYDTISTVEFSLAGKEETNEYVYIDEIIENEKS